MEYREEILDGQEAWREVMRLAHANGMAVIISESGWYLLYQPVEGHLRTCLKKYHVIRLEQINKARRMIEEIEGAKRGGGRSLRRYRRN
jgi:hypothetical protein